MKKSNAHNKFLWERRPISRLQQTLAGLVASLPMWLPTVASADIGDAAKQVVQRSSQFFILC